MHFKNSKKAENDKKHSGFQSPDTLFKKTVVINIQITQSSNCISQSLSTCQFFMIKSLKYEQHYSFRFLLKWIFRQKRLLKTFLLFFITHIRIVVKYVMPIAVGHRYCKR